MKSLVLVSLTILQSGEIIHAIENNQQQREIIHETENNQHLAAQALQILTQTFPLRHTLQCINKSLVTLNGKIDQKQKKAFVMHHEDVTRALDKVSELCNKANASLLNKEKPENILHLLVLAQMTLKNAQKELNHYEVSFKNHVQEINEAKS